MRRQVFSAAVIGLSLGLLAACSQPSTEAQSTVSAPSPSGIPSSSTTADPDNATAAEQQFPDVLAAELSPSGDGFTVAVTISSPYDTADRYADGWRVLSPSGEVLAEHQLGHDHASEQPFTRTSSAFTIPAEIDEVVVEGRDQANGFGGETVTVAVPR
ncbi:hypothetical protein [Demequina aurantiaca]|uniref:hypothetical protein n=1 Tax=Demequina aurantiaca TaxID=676200 RepID=UPI003D327F9A